MLCTLAIPQSHSQAITVTLEPNIAPSNLHGFSVQELLATNETLYNNY